MSHFVVPNHIVVGKGVLNEAAPLLKRNGQKGFYRNRQTHCGFGYDEKTNGIA